MRERIIMNLARLKECMKRAERGEHLTLGFLGGSITEGSLSSSPEMCYAYLVYKWWEKSFPQAEFSYVNGGIGGTTSHFGAARAVPDVLMYQPDVVIVDFSVNDKANIFFRETYEGLLRKILDWPSRPAVILLNNVYYDTGESAQDEHNTVGNHYQLLHISMRDTLYQDILRGKYTREELTKDGLHPNDKDHRLVAGIITGVLEQVKALRNEPEEDYVMPEPLTENAYEKARLLTAREISPALSGFLEDAAEKTGHFKDGWIGRKAGDSILFETEASCIAVQYRKTVKRPALSAHLVLDGDEEHPLLLDGNFEEDWGDCFYLESVLHHGERKKHTVRITVSEGEAGAEAFYLLSLVVA